MVTYNNKRITDGIIKCLLVLFIITVALPVRTANYLIDLRVILKPITLFIFCLTLGAAQRTEAQGLKRFVNKYQVGFESSFGIKSFRIASDIPEISNLRVLGEGGTIGIVCGAKSLVVKVRQGFFYSASSVAHTVDEVRSSALMNFYPLYFVNEKFRFRPYLLVGIERTGFHMYGYYDANDHSTKNYSVSEAPYLGKISAVQSSVGAGIEHRIKTPGHFVAIFSEVRYAKAIRVTSSNELFAGTTPSGQLMMNIGIGFGYYR